MAKYLSCKNVWIFFDLPSAVGSRTKRFGAKVFPAQNKVLQCNKTSADSNRSAGLIRGWDSVQGMRPHFIVAQTSF